MKKILILEDDPERVRYFTKNFLNAKKTISDKVDIIIEKLKESDWDMLFLDHDLGGHTFVPSGKFEQTGYDVAKFLRDNPQFLPKEIFVHSLNPVGSENIMNLIPCKRIPFIWNKVIDFAT